MKLVVDTNIIIASILKDSTTRKILLHPLFSFCIPDHAFIEIERHEEELMRKSGLTRHRFHLILKRIQRRLTMVPEHEFAGFYPRAHKIMEDIDQTDAPFIALALSFDNNGLWSNDKHLEQQNAIRVWSTRELIEELRQVEEEIYR